MSDEKPLEVMPNAARQAHTRVIKTRPVTFECAECGQLVTEDLFPGPAPKYCNGCIRAVRQRQNAERVKRHRARKRSEG